MAKFAILLALGSSRVERRGPDHALYCGLGKVQGVEVNCPEPPLNGGWPAPYLFDRPGISAERQLGFFEDEFRVEPFVADVAFYTLILLAAAGLRRRPPK